MDRTLRGVICYLDNSLVITKGEVSDQNLLDEKVKKRLDKKIEQ